MTTPEDLILFIGICCFLFWLLPFLGEKSSNLVNYLSFGGFTKWKRLRRYR